ncbi:aldehyde dehydrogenase family protein [Thauera linaloolentis]|uniref:Aldehyde Dehydrogenase n=1 Tax=Thauera linaloolentis (strain DSM 12138 / JCM 21573 / CCUG 41526 / CIP 105981 / IAM 15112 / NBRC 102519 / 47Lol) TaxID=1123367 RepID=N6YAG9_THAL4|nr:aldehyde dehydrogenase family protein [Thauera linaloolentis]ENO88510.1 aldehyde Dehydrogenase [Thauera linaloolentis 47Lol = DSM 12138]MCM8567473.1 aldehyde dehydrogenase family protein [Thauera linaloolentis]
MPARHVLPDERFTRLRLGCEHVRTARRRPVINPATGAAFASVPVAGPEHLDAAVAAARAAFPAWRALSWDARQARLEDLAGSMQRARDELADLLTLEQGKPRHSAAADEVDYAIGWLREVVTRRLTDEVLEDTPRHRVEKSCVPLGVAGLIVPWNFPLCLAVWKLAPALITGNTAILKPSPHTPLTALRLAELAEGILPPGVLTVLTGDDELGRWMVEHPGIAKISFTGSVATGRKVMAGAAATLKRVTLELGGNDPAIVLPDADIDAVVPRLFWGAFGNSGQWCVGIKRLYVHDDIYPRLLAALADYARGVQMGDGMDPASQLGPLQNAGQHARVLGLLADCSARGFRFALGGGAGPGPGYFVPPAIVDNPPDDSRVVREEAFGPLLPVLRYRDFDDVVRRANDTEYGLGASVWGRDLALARALAGRLEAGTVWINEVYVHGVDFPFGGHKLSGLGVEHGAEGLAAYADVRVFMSSR